MINADSRDVMKTDPRAPGESAAAMYPPAFPVVGVGASAGGLKALGQLFADIPPDTGMAFVVIQHLDPSHDSQLTALLAKSSRLPVELAAEGTAVQPDRVYVIAPNTRIGIEQGILHISPREAGPSLRLGIDAFLGSLAADRPGCAIGVILSGTGSDGTLGLAAIRAAGGITFAQDDTAEFTGMPQSAVSHGGVDFVLPPAAIAQEIGKFARFGFPCLRKLPGEQAVEPAEQPTDAAESFPDEPLEYAKIISLLKTTTGVDFTHYRAQTIMRRTARRMALAAKTSLADYMQHLGEVPDEIEALARDIVIHVTSFYRDPAAFAALRSEVFPALVDAQRNQAAIRVWVVGCSTGQEVYSLAIELVEYLKQVPAAPQVQIFATDISDWALAQARTGLYAEPMTAGLPPELLTCYFTKEAKGYRVIKEIRELCVFAKHDITADIPFSHIDFISCRNVLIYLGPVLQDYVLPTFHFSLNPGGFLLLGAAETLGRSAGLYDPIDEKHRLFRALVSPGRVRPQPVWTRRADAHAIPLPTPPSIPSLADVQRAADDFVLSRFAPASVLINDAMQVIQFRGRTNAFLEPAQGEASLHLLSMVPFGVAEALSGALAEAKQRKVLVRRTGVVQRRQQNCRDISFEIMPITLPTSAMVYLVLFDEARPDAVPVQATDSPAAADTVATAGAPHPRELVELRRELTAATTSMQSLVELNHGLNEQLSDAQDEVQSSKEEYCSTNQELQTSKEEIEATNQELIIINDELRESENRYRRIVETANEGIWIIDAEARTTFVNPKLANMLGYSVAEMMGRSREDFMDDEGRARTVENHLRCQQGFCEQHDFNFRRKDGAEICTHMATNPIQDSTGTYAGAMAMVTDITDRKHLENELRQAQKMEAIGRLAGGIAHDFNNQLMVIQGFGGMAIAKTSDQALLRCLNHIVQASERSADLVRQLLTFSRKGRHTVAPVDVHALITDMLDVLSRSLNKMIRLTTSFGVNQAITQGNASLLQSAFLNISLNARDAMPEGGDLHFTTAVVEADAATIARLGGAMDPGPYLQISISDTGHGMSEEVHSHLFEPFFTTKAAGKGTGLGLAAVYGTISQHGGGIEVDSAPGRGTTIRVYLPRLITRASLAAETSNPPAPMQPGAATVLVIDDEELVAALVEDALTSNGHHVVCKTDGITGLEYYRTHWRHIDLIVLDMNMPRMGGAETFAAMRVINHTANVLIMSGYSDDGGVEALLHQGAMGFLPKPFSSHDLTSIVAQLLNEAQVGRSVSVSA